MEQLDEITGVGVTAAQELIAELGTDMIRFTAAGHLVSWAKFAPIDRSSTGKAKGSSTGKGNPWLAATVGEIVTAARTDTFLGERYHRIARHRGKTGLDEARSDSWPGNSPIAGRSPSRSRLASMPWQRG